MKKESAWCLLTLNEEEISQQLVRCLLTRRNIQESLCDLHNDMSWITLRRVS